MPNHHDRPGIESLPDRFRRTASAFGPPLRFRKTSGSTEVANPASTLVDPHVPISAEMGGSVRVAERFQAGVGEVDRVG